MQEEHAFILQRETRNESKKKIKNPKNNQGQTISKHVKTLARERPIRKHCRVCAPCTKVLLCVCLQPFLPVTLKQSNKGNKPNYLSNS